MYRMRMFVTGLLGVLLDQKLTLLRLSVSLAIQASHKTC